MSVPDEFRGGPLLDVNGQLVGMLFIGERGLRFGLPIGSLVGVPRMGKVAEFKSQTQENYFETVEGNNFAGRAAMGLDEQMTARLHLEKAVKVNPSDLGGRAPPRRHLRPAKGLHRGRIGLPEGHRARPDAGRRLLRPGHHPATNRRSTRTRPKPWKRRRPWVMPARRSSSTSAAAYEAVPDFAKAAAAYEKYISLGPADAWSAYHRLGICRTNLGEFDAAIAALLEAAESPAQGPQGPRIALAEAYVKAGQLENAEAVYTAMAGINPPDAKSYHTPGLPDVRRRREGSTGPSARSRRSSSSTPRTRRISITSA